MSLETQTINPTVLSHEEAQFIEIMADLVEQWGFKRHLGRVWGILYLRKDPLNPAQIQDLVGLSAGNTNQIINELQTWGVIKRSRQALDRKTYYVADDQIWKSITNVLKARELRILAEALSSLEKLESKLEPVKATSQDLGHEFDRIRKVKTTLVLMQNLATLTIQASSSQLDKLIKVLDKLRIL